MVNQTIFAAGMIGVCEGLLYGYKAGLDLERVMQSVAAGSAGSWSLSKPRHADDGQQFRPGFFVEHLVKDLGIALAEAKRMRLALPGLALAEQLYISLQAIGHGRDGTQALMLAWQGCRGLIGREGSKGGGRVKLGKENGLENSLEIRPRDEA